MEFTRQFAVSQKSWSSRSAISLGTSGLVSWWPPFGALEVCFRWITVVTCSIHGNGLTSVNMASPSSVASTSDHSEPSSSLASPLSFDSLGLSFPPAPLLSAGASELKLSSASRLLVGASEVLFSPAPLLSPDSPEISLPSASSSLDEAHAEGFAVRAAMALHSSKGNGVRLGKRSTMAICSSFLRVDRGRAVLPCRQTAFMALNLWNCSKAECD
ncbi:hypothetical protein HBI26_217420 [Parastagonospora nodorum]|nr:hypothetical protein HBH50_202230 [Parastagonospora nodorum]KAH4081555.1 hypothetical protein HBH48_197880 [Parastagonospora nodorum]KAH4406227.1 hypothetical protein HBH93_230220 [Parastagonospora nodorum]KAH4430787.1 hypothetical protein HBH91_235740 [Parastagonospora nodorum]KAH4526336.1 hypothetical protein HBH86_229570 [Parastagonospora nodorum]